MACGFQVYGFHMEKARAAYALLTPLFLIIGVGVYFLFRDLNNLLLFAWMPRPEFLGNAIIQLPPSVLSGVVKYNLAGMFWFVSGILFFRFVWFHRPNVQRAYIGCFYGIGAILEISQLSERVPGTFDFMDLCFMGIGAFGEGLLYNIFVKRRTA